MVDCVEFRGAKEFQTRFIDLAAQARYRVGMKTMNYIEDGDFPKGFTDSIIMAAKREVVTHFTFDSSSYVCPDGQDSSLLPVLVRRLLWSEVVLEQRQRTLDKLDEMRDTEVNVHSSNPLNLITGQLPYLKRDHRKVAVVDDTGWVIDINLNQAPRDHPAIIYETRQQAIVDYLYDVIIDGYCDSVPPHDQYGHFLISDSGRVLQSNIYEVGKEVASEGGDYIYLGTQVLPGMGLVNRLIKACRDGSRVVLVTSDQNKFRRFPYKPFYEAFKARIAGLKNFDLLHYPDYMHAKFLEAPTSALIGSSNLAFSGILFGTQELDVLIKNESSLQKLHTKIEDILKSSRVPN